MNTTISISSLKTDVWVVGLPTITLLRHSSLPLVHHPDFEGRLVDENIAARRGFSAASAGAPYCPPGCGCVQRWIVIEGLIVALSRLPEALMPCSFWKALRAAESAGSSTGVVARLGLASKLGEPAPHFRHTHRRRLPAFTRAPVAIGSTRFAACFLAKVVPGPSSSRIGRMLGLEALEIGCGEGRLGQNLQCGLAALSRSGVMSL